jgi:hypothetical protein
MTIEELNPRWRDLYLELICRERFFTEGPAVDHCVEHLDSGMRRNDGVSAE